MIIVLEPNFTSTLIGVFFSVMVCSTTFHTLGVGGASGRKGKIWRIVDGFSRHRPGKCHLLRAGAGRRHGEGPLGPRLAASVSGSHSLCQPPECSRSPPASGQPARPRPTHQKCIRVQPSSWKPNMSLLIIVILTKGNQLWNENYVNVGVSEIDIICLWWILGIFKVVTEDCPRSDMKQFVWLPNTVVNQKVFHSKEYSINNKDRKQLFYKRRIHTKRTYETLKGTFVTSDWEFYG